MACRLAIVLLVLLTASTGAAPSVSWQKAAQRLTGYSEGVRREALRALRAIPDIETVLLSEVRTGRRHLALDAIAALKLEKLVPELLPLVETDQTGAVGLAINALLSPETAPGVAAAYAARIERLAGRPAFLPAQLAMLDVLGRLGFGLPKSTMNELAASESPELREALVSYARSMVRETRSEELVALLAQAGTDPDTRVRRRALYAIADLGPPRTRSLLRALERCVDDREPDMRQLCRELLEKRP